MASLFKRSRQVIDPATGKPKTHPKTGKVMRAESRTWYGKYRDADGIIRRVKLVADRGTAVGMLAQIELQENRRRAGLFDPTEVHLKRPLAEHLADYEKTLIAKGSNDVYLKNTIRFVRDILAGCKFVFVKDLLPSRLVEWLAEYRRGGASAASSNHHLVAFKGFLNWGRKDGRWPSNPMDVVKRQNVKVDRRRVRRSLSTDEFARLIAATESSPKTVCGLTGPDRSALYVCAAFTGFRASELASLTPTSFDWSAGLVRLQAENSKHRSDDALPIHSELETRLKPWTTRRNATERLWPGKWASKRHGAEMVRSDLEAASIPFADDSGRVFDFHSLRGQFAVALARAGVHPRAAQMLMRHSSVDLTMNAYSHLGVVDLENALGSIPGIGKPTPESGVLAATGTDGKEQQKVAPKMAPRIGPKGAQNGPKQASSQPLRIAPNFTDDRMTVDDEGIRENPGKDSVKSTSKGTRYIGFHPNAEERTRTSTPLRELEPESSPAESPTDAETISNQAFATTSGEPADGVGPKMSQSADLQAVAEAWHRLPQAIRDAILAIVKANQSHG